VSPAVVVVPCAYLLGTFPAAQLVGGARGHDPTREGSGNPGASNVYRLAGRRAGATVFALDLVKGALATGAGYALDGR
jgi:glycerol-3-phosphate acyltransferase PlsY